MSEPNKCQYVVWAGSYLDPPEYCPNDVDTPYHDDYCGDHLPYDARWDDDGDPWDETFDWTPLDPQDYEFDE